MLICLLRAVISKLWPDDLQPLSVQVAAARLHAACVRTLLLEATRKITEEFVTQYVNIGWALTDE